jgi:tetratricopeptide (TPR) repeat protein
LETVKEQLSARPGRDSIYGLILVLSIVLVYQPVWSAGFIWDDGGHVTRPELRSLAGLGRIWFTLGATQQYYPLVHSVFWVEYQLWGDWPLPYHLVNVILFACSALLLCRVLRQLEIPGAWLATAIFALHPVQVESVAWVTELKNVLSGLFYFAAALAYLKFDATRDRRAYLTAFVWFVLGLASKSVIASLPAALLVVFWWKRGKLSWKSDVLPLVPFFIVGIGSGLFTAYVESHYIIREDAGNFNYTFLERTLIAGHAVWFYLGKLTWPAGLMFIYPRWQIGHAFTWDCLYPATGIALAGVLLFSSRKWRGPLAGFLFFAGTLFPALGFFNVYPFQFSFVADHFQYLAGLGIIVPVAAGLTLTTQRLLPGKVSVILAVGLLLLGGLSWRRAGFYQNEEKLWLDTLAQNPSCWLAHTNLGDIEIRRGQVDEAMRHYQQALLYHSEYAEGHYNLGQVFSKKGQTANAIAEFQKALDIHPDFVLARINLGWALTQSGKPEEGVAQYQKALETNPRYGLAHYYMGLAQLQKGQSDNALAEFREAVEDDPGLIDARYNLGLAFFNHGQLDEAIGQFETALLLNPGSADVSNSLCLALLRKGQLPEAIARGQQAVQLAPHMADAHFNLGNAYLAARQVDGAIAEFETAVNLNPNYPDAHNNLAVALFERGRLEEAVAQFREFVRLNPNDSHAKENLAKAQELLARQKAAGGK